MARARHQTGRVEQRGTRTKTWRGHYYQYVIDETGTEKRVHRNVDLGLCSEKGKRQAEKELQEIILRETNSVIRLTPQNTRTLAHFVENVYIPSHSNWSPATRDNFKNYYSVHIKPTFGTMDMTEITRMMIQVHLNGLAQKGYSKALVSKTKTHITSILELAVDEDLLPKNAAAKCSIPECKAQVKNVISIQDYAWFMANFDKLRDETIFQVAAFAALRPSELFALRWKNYDGLVFHVKNRVYKGKVEERTKNKASRGLVYLPKLVRSAIDRWKANSPNNQPEDFIFSGFAAKDGSKLHKKPLKFNNWRRRTLFPLCLERNLSFNVTFQILRRSAGTIAQKFGSMKDVQTLYRHAKISTTAEIYVQEIPESVISMMDQFAEVVFREVEGHKPPTSTRLELVKKSA